MTKPQKDNAFRQHLRRCSKIVATWPTWKRKALTPPIDQKKKVGDQ